MMMNYKRLVAVLLIEASGWSSFETGRERARLQAFSRSASNTRASSSACPGGKVELRFTTSWGRALGQRGPPIVAPQGAFCPVARHPSCLARFWRARYPRSAACGTGQRQFQHPNSWGVIGSSGLAVGPSGGFSGHPNALPILGVHEVIIGRRHCDGGPFSTYSP